MSLADKQGLLSRDHFSVDGTDTGMGQSQERKREFPAS
jgi:hypothetical protein